MIMMTNLIVLIAVVAAFVAADSARFIRKEIMNSREDFVLRSKADPSAMHEVIFAVKQLNLDKLEQEVLERATPGSGKYLKWMTFDQVGELITNHEGADATINWLSEHGIKYSWMSKRKEYIKASAAVSTWEKLFDTTFSNYVDQNPHAGYKGDLVRAAHYSLPVELASHVDAVFNTVQAPPVIHKDMHRKDGEKTRQDFRPNMRNVKKALAAAEEKAIANGSNLVTTVAYLDEYYKISSNLGDASLAQSVFETSEEYFSQGDLAEFQIYFNLTKQAANDIGGFETSACDNNNNCDEGNLDTQYIMGISQITASTYWYVSSISGNPFVTWVTDLADERNPPQSNSMSWGSIEQQQPASVLNSFNTEAMKLGAIGVTVTVSSGDNGVANSGCGCTTPSGSATSSWAGAGSWTGTGYFPSFPASCPYVTAVGATMGSGGYPPSLGESELACQSQLGGVITSGGGFSTFYPVPSWQRNATSDYFTQLNTFDEPSSGYNKNGRGIPDMAMLGVWYQVFLDGSLTSLFGTSCSSPLTAGMVSLINAARLVKGLGSVGYMNPTLYSNTGSFTDVTSGSNNCCAYTGFDPNLATCCKSGFQATKGWDPITGLGSIQYDSLATLFSS